MFGAIAKTSKKKVQNAGFPRRGSLGLGTLIPTHLPSNSLNFSNFPYHSLPPTPVHHTRPQVPSTRGQSSVLGCFFFSFPLIPPLLGPAHYECDERYHDKNASLRVIYAETRHTCWLHVQHSHLGPAPRTCTHVRIIPPGLPMHGVLHTANLVVLRTL